MSEFFYVIKLFLLTLVIVLVMQIQIGERTFESHAMSWLHTSALVAPLNMAATGGAKMIKDLTAKVNSSITKNSDKNVEKNKKEEKKSSPSFRWGHFRKATPPAENAND
ncbi:MAG: hypothetical protein KF799_03010 [Bdellovibrionales bacterium]|nr:hypothetical protein [Bdellovibrionales bacterium]